MALRKDIAPNNDGDLRELGNGVQVFDDAVAEVSGDVLGKIASNAYAAAVQSPALASILGPAHLEDFHKLIDANVAHVVKKVLEYQAGKAQ